MIWILGLWGCTESTVSSSSLPKFPVVQLEVNGQSHSVEYACAPHEVALGLRYRQLKENEGMVLCAQKGSSLSMKKMKSPISAAFLSSKKEIISVVELSLSAADYPISSDVVWVWEMPQNWFRKQGITPGTVVTGLEK